MTAAEPATPQPRPRGRPPGYAKNAGGQTRRVNISLDPATHAALTSAGGGNVSQGIRLAVAAMLAQHEQAQQPARPATPTPAA